jgi:putative oxidoreductase
MLKKLCNCKNIDLTLLFVRVALAVIFIHHGYDKMINMNETISLFNSLGFGVYWAYIATIAELLGGILVLFGFFVNIIGYIFAVDMFAVIYVVKQYNGFSNFELEFVLLICSLAFAIFGTGKYSLQEVLKEKKGNTI